MIVGIEHVAIATPDVRKLAQWYVDVLGFVINCSSELNAFVKAPDGSMIEIITAEGARTPQTMKNPGLRHVALTVDNIEAEYARLKGAGVKFVTELTDTNGSKLAFFEDPDGNCLHLLQRDRPLA